MRIALAKAVDAAEFLANLTDQFQKSIENPLGVRDPRCGNELPETAQVGP